jgi:ankyrin repeat protein
MVTLIDLLKLERNNRPSDWEQQVNELIEKKIDINAADGDGKAALWFAIDKNETAIIEKLKSAGAIAEPKNLIDLPPEIIFTLLSKIPFQNLSALQQTTKYFDAANTHYHWKKNTQFYFPHINIQNQNPENNEQQIYKNIYERLYKNLTPMQKKIFTLATERQVNELLAIPEFNFQSLELKDSNNRSLLSVLRDYQTILDKFYNNFEEGKFPYPPPYYSPMYNVPQKFRPILVAIYLHQDWASIILKQILRIGNNILVANTISIPNLVCFAAATGHTEAMEELIRFASVDINAHDMDDRTALSYAAQHGQTETVTKLVTLVANVDEADDNGRTPLSYAAQDDHTETIMKLVTSGASVDAPDGNGRTPLSYAVTSGKLEACKLLIAKKANVNRANPDGQTLLLLAVEKGNIEIIKLLIAEKPNVNRANQDGQTPLLLAVEKGNIEIIKLLIAEKADVNIVSQDGQTALHFAVLQNNIQLINLLIDNKADVNIVNQYGNTPLLLAAQQNNIQLIKLLIDNEANVNIVNQNGQTPLHCALIYGFRSSHEPASHVQLITSLIKVTDVNAADNNMYTPLHHASKIGLISAVRTLLDNGAQPNALTKKGKTALHLAAVYANAECIEILLNHKSDIHALDVEGNSVLHWAAASGDLECVKILLNHLDKLNMQANIYAVNKEGLTALHWALKSKYTGSMNPVVTLLLEKGPQNLNSATKKGLTPLFMSILYSRPATSALLLRQGAKLISANPVQLYRDSIKNLNLLNAEKKESPMYENPMIIQELSKYSENNMESSTSIISNSPEPEHPITSLTPSIESSYSPPSLITNLAVERPKTITLKQGEEIISSYLILKNSKFFSRYSSETFTICQRLLNPHTSNEMRAQALDTYMADDKNKHRDFYKIVTKKFMDTDGCYTFKKDTVENIRNLSQEQQPNQTPRPY